MTFTIRINLRSAPECPVCRQPLLPAMFTSLERTALCSDCFHVVVQDWLPDFRKAIEHPSLDRSWSTAIGIRFFTPENVIPSRAGILAFTANLR